MATNLAGVLAAIQTPSFAKLRNANIVNSGKLFKSGLVSMRADIATSLNTGAKNFGVAYWKPLDTTLYVPTTDYKAELTDVQRLSGGSQSGVRRLAVLRPVAVTDLESHLVGADLVQVAKDLLADAVAERLYLEAIHFAQTIVGLDTDAGTAGTQTGLVYASGATAFTFDAFVDAVKGHYGDRGQLSGNILVMHSATARGIRKEQLSKAGGLTDPAAQVNGDFYSWMGNIVIEDDSIALDKVFVFKRGAFGFATGQSPHITEVEVKREALADNGGGANVVIQRLLFGMHIDGISFTGAINGSWFIAGDVQDTLSNWTMVRDVKDVGVMVIDLA